MLRPLPPLVALLLAAPAMAVPPPAPFTAADFGRLRISQRPCWLNAVKQTCVLTAGADGEVMRIDFSAGDRPFWVFTPTGTPTTERRPYRDAQGRTWLYSGHRLHYGHHSFQLVEQGPDRNVIRVEAP